MKLRFLITLLGGAGALAFAVPASASTAITDYTFSGDVTGTVELDFDSSQTFPSPYTLGWVSLSTNGITFTGSDIHTTFTYFGVGNVSIPFGTDTGESLYVSFDPSLASPPDGSFTSANGSSIPLHFTVTQPGAVPEPATWAMMLLGFTAIGWAMRQRKPAQTVTGQARFSLL